MTLLLRYLRDYRGLVAVALLLAVTVGVQYGNSIPAILVGVPGTPAAVLTVLDGFALHKRGETGLALGLALMAVGGFGLLSLPVVMLHLAYLRAGAPPGERPEPWWLGWRQSPGLAAVAAEFDSRMIAADGSLDRAALAAVVFSDHGARARLESITHPLVRARFAHLRDAAAPDAVVPMAMSTLSS